MSQEEISDIEFIQLLEHAQAELDRGVCPKKEIVARLVVRTRILLTQLFAARQEAERFRVDLHLMEQGQLLLSPMLEVSPSHENQIAQN